MNDGSGVDACPLFLKISWCESESGVTYFTSHKLHTSWSGKTKSAPLCLSAFYPGQSPKCYFSGSTTVDMLVDLCIDWHLKAHMVQHMPYLHANRSGTCPELHPNLETFRKLELFKALREDEFSFIRRRLSDFPIKIVPAIITSIRQALVCLLSMLGFEVSFELYFIHIDWDWQLDISKLSELDTWSSE